MCIQLLLPESQLNLDSLLARYAAAGSGISLHPHAVSRADAAGDAAATYAGNSPGGAAGCKPGTGNELNDVLARVMLKACDKSSNSAGPATGKPTSGTAAAAETGMHAAGTGSSSGSSGVVSSSSFWQLFSSHVTVICVSEIKYSLMGQSCLACPGAVTLVNNLVHSVDSQALLHAQCEQAPLAVQEYLQGSTNELYEVRTATAAAAAG